MEQKKKFVLEFDEPPAFVYVAESPDKEQLYVNGNILKGWTSLELKTNMEDMPEYTIKGFVIKEYTFK